jgi:protein TonB
MLNENRIRLLMFLIVAVIHIVLIFFLTFNMKIDSQVQPENARMMRLTDFSEIKPEPPPPPPPPKEIVEIPQVESIAETMIETDEVPDQIIVAPGAITTPTPAPAAPSWDDYLPMHRVTDPPKLNEKEIYADLVYPPIALRSGIEGRVILELFIDLNGQIQRILVMQENPKDRGFGEAAVKAFTGKRGVPAYADGKPVSTRYRYPLSFKIK